METIKSISATMLCCILAAGFNSCTNVDEPQPDPAPNEEVTTYEVSLNLAGEYTDVSEKPLSRVNEATPKKYYGINVYCMKTDGTENTYSHYAYGVFDNVADMKINLLVGYKYKFECTSVTENTDKLFISIHNEAISSPVLPFAIKLSENSYLNCFTKDINKFITSQNRYLSFIKEGVCHIKGNETGNMRSSSSPRMDRFYGELEDFLPVSGAIVSIPMKRTAFGITVVVNGVPDGILTWENNNLEFNCDGCTGVEKLEYPQIYTFAEVYNCWKSKEVYSKDYTINFTWTRANGYKQYFNEIITVKRNIMTTITVNLKGGTNNVAIGINEDQTPMKNEDINVDYEGENINDTPVNPNGPVVKMQLEGIAITEGQSTTILSNFVYDNQRRLTSYDVNDNGNKKTVTYTYHSSYIERNKIGDYKSTYYLENGVITSVGTDTYEYSNGNMVKWTEDPPFYISYNWKDGNPIRETVHYNGKFDDDITNFSYSDLPCFIGNLQCLMDDYTSSTQLELMGGSMWDPFLQQQGYYGNLPKNLVLSGKDKRHIWHLRYEINTNGYPTKITHKDQDENTTAIMTLTWR